jgi:60 kDa SS-A/Ro ribonucleoprotein
MKYADIVSADVPQTEALNERQVKNNAGGFVFAIDDWARLDRFLILGSDAPTYYQKAPALIRENAKVVDRCLAADAARTVARTVEISDQGRAPKNDPAIFVLAIGAAHPDQAVRKLALGGGTKSLPDRDAPVPVREGGAGTRPRLGPVAQDGDRQLVQFEVPG